MQDLRLIGVHEDGQHLLLTDSEGGRYRVPLDEPLRAAARRDRPRLGQLQIEIDGGMRPREVQALIRSGFSAEEVADRAGWTVEKVRRYEGPILAEREHVATLARQVRLRGRGGGQGEAPTLAARVGERLTGRGVDPAVAQWDSARSEDGAWTVMVTFPAGGRERSARWAFDVPARTVSAVDDEARWLSEDDSAGTASPLPAPHLVSAPVRATTVYDVEAEGGVGASARRKSSQAAAGGREEPVDLMTAMRERASARGRRGRRKGAAVQTPLDEAPREDALPLEDIAYDPESMPPPPAARGPHPRDEEAVDAAVAATEGPDAPDDDLADDDLADDDLADDGVVDDGVVDDGVVDDGVVDDGVVDDRVVDDGVGTDVLPAAENAATVDHPHPNAELEPGADLEPDGELVSGPEAGPEPEPGTVDRGSAAPERAAVGARTARRNGRPSVPSWDDVMFGAKPRD